MIPVKIPKLGLTMESASIARWVARSGDKVTKDQVVLVIETDKVTYEVTAPAGGIFHPVVPEGSICAVEQEVAYIASDSGEYREIASKYKSAGEVPFEREKPCQSESDQKKEEPGRFKVSPLARAMAREHGLDLALIKGSGPGGRIVRADILAALEKASDMEAGVRKTGQETAFEAVTEKIQLERIPIRGARKVIFDNMFASISGSAQLTLHTEASAEALVYLRNRLRTEDSKPSYNALLIKMTATVLRRHPRLNASLSGQDLVVWKDINIGLAMESGDILVVPVVRDAFGKNIKEIDSEVKTFTEKARRGGLVPDDMAEGTFTITNLGFADIDLFTPIIRPPEIAILGVGRIVKKPWVKDDMVVGQHRIGLSLTFDHRIIDGAPAARFLKDLKDTIEEPILMLV